jgi:hypothetical protein
MEEQAKWIAGTPITGLESGKTYDLRMTVMGDGKETTMVHQSVQEHVELPPPPEPAANKFGGYYPEYSEDQMRDYARAAVLQERARCEQVVRAEISRAESLMSVEDGGGPVFDREQTEAGIAALQTVASAIRSGKPTP